MKKTINLLIILLGAITIPASAQTCDAFVGGYVPSYRDPTAVDYTKLSHVFYAFGATNHAGEIIVGDQEVFNSFKSAAVGKQRFLSIGGAGDNSLSDMTESAVAIQTFATNCVTFCQQNNLQGIDVDWEGIITAPDSAKYGSLMRGLATALHTNGLKLTATIAYGSYGGDYYNVGALKIADWIQLMVYDQTGTWSESPYGNHSTYQHMLDAIQYWTGRGYSDLSRIVIGLPFYGYQFASYDGGLATGLSYGEIAGTYPFLPCDQDEVSMIVFNSPETIRKKTRYVMTHGLKGVMIWEMGQDLPSDEDRSLLKTVSLAVCDLPAACDNFVTGLPGEAAKEEIQAVPNPVTDALYLSLKSSGDRIIKYELTDNLGRLITEKSEPGIEDIECIHFSRLAQGVYYLKVSLASRRVTVRRIAKI